jgi:poly(A) polymerase
MNPTRTSYTEHGITRDDVSKASLRIVSQLHMAGHEAYIVGGSVRDLLAGVKPKDFDIATSAYPEQVRQVFGRQCRLIGRRFVIAHVYAGGEEPLEVTTFRGDLTDAHARDETGRVLSDNQYGTLVTDANRRDFTVNALYLDASTGDILDFCDGLSDLKSRTIRLIGNPELRYREDPVRMLRAIRIANKLHFNLHPDTEAALRPCAPLLAEVPAARYFEEILKILHTPQALANFQALRQFGLFGVLFPQSEGVLQGSAVALRFIELALQRTALRIERQESVSPTFLYAVLLWPAVAALAWQLQSKRKMHPNVALTTAADTVIERQLDRIAIPKRFSAPMREMWLLQPKFDQRRGQRPYRLAENPRFRAAYDLLLLRAEAGEGVEELASWWTLAQRR